MSDDSRQTAGALWLQAALKQTPDMRRLIASAIGFDATDRRAFYALLPFAMIHDDGRWWLAATNQPPYTAHPDQIVAYDPDDADVMLFDPAKNEARMWFDETPGLFRPQADDSLVIHTDARAFLRQWAEARASHCVAMAAMLPADRAAFLEPRNGFMPGAFVVGPISRCRWNGMPRHVVVKDKAKLKSIRQAIDRDANRPIVSGDDDVA